jgi:hypothetical protein
MKRRLVVPKAAHVALRAAMELAMRNQNTAFRSVGHTLVEIALGENVVLPFAKFGNTGEEFQALCAWSVADRSWGASVAFDGLMAPAFCALRSRLIELLQQANARQSGSGR